MARIAGVNIPTNKRVLIALQYIHGIGPAAAKDIIGKVGIEEVDSSLGTAIRTVVVLVMAWVVVAVTGEGRQLSVIPRRDLVFIAVATPRQTLCFEHQFPGSRHQIRAAATEAALRHVLAAIENHHS